MVGRLEHLLRLDHFRQNRAAAEQLRAKRRLRVRSRPESVKTLQDAVRGALRHDRHRVLLVHHREVVEDAFLLDVHPSDAVLDDDGNLVGERRVVGHAVGIGEREQLAVAVLVLKPFARQRRASGRPAQQETTRARVGSGPDQVADALEAEHRVVDEEWDGVDAVGGVGGARGDERRHRAGFGDPFLENLPVGCFLVVQEHVHVDRLVELTDVRVDADLPEQRLHPEGARFVGHDRHDRRPTSLSRSSFDNTRTATIVVEALRPSVPL